ncbi:hypothetical protein LY76DRAFT_591305 [Colletotrichum caudatum]|nr:hypothetical protein LY76DRAFT_591305 [Colletotrichum caudatum]
MAVVLQNISLLLVVDAVLGFTYALRAARNRVHYPTRRPRLHRGCRGNRQESKVRAASAFASLSPLLLLSLFLDKGFALRFMVHHHSTDGFQRPCAQDLGFPGVHLTGFVRHLDRRISSHVDPFTFMSDMASRVPQSGTRLARTPALAVHSCEFTPPLPIPGQMKPSPDPLVACFPG